MSRSISDWQTRIHENAKKKGFYDNWHPQDGRAIAEKLCLIHSEVSEAFEELRAGHRDGIYCNTEKPDKPEGIPIEIADVVIRCLDLAGAMGFDLEHAINLKHNTTLVGLTCTAGKSAR